MRIDGVRQISVKTNKRKPFYPLLTGAGNNPIKVFKNLLSFLRVHCLFLDQNKTVVETEQE
jgi:hypothetical protein